MKKKKMKSNQVLALFLCTLVLLCSIGLVLAQVGKTPVEYSCEDLKLTQFQDNYDLKSGIKYDEKKYVLSVTSPGGFDINTPGTYQVAYQLTPILQTQSTLPSPAPAGGAAAPGQSGGSVPSAGSGGGTSVEPNAPDNPGDGADQPADKPTPGKPDADKPADKPAPGKPDADQPADKPAPGKPDADQPADKPAPTKPDADKPADKPAPTKPDADQSADKPAPTKPDGDQPADKPASTKPDAEKPADKPAPAKADADTSSAKSAQSKPNADNDKLAATSAAQSASARWNQTASDTSQRSVAALPPASFQSETGAIFASQTLFTGNSSYGVGAGTALPLTFDANGAKAAKTPVLLADSQSGGKDQGNSGTGNVDGKDSPAGQSADKNQSGTGAGNQDSNSPAGGHSGTGSGAAGAAGDQSGDKKPGSADSGSTGDHSGAGAGNQDSSTPAGSQSGSGSGSTADQSGAGSAGNQSGAGSGSTGDPSGDKKPGGAGAGNQDSSTSADGQGGAGSGSTGNQSDTGAGSGSTGGQSSSGSGSGSAGNQSGAGAGNQDSSTPAGGQSGSGSGSTADQSGSGSTGDQSGTGSGTGAGPAAGDHEAPLMPIDFTRTIVVEPAVTYDNLRLDVHSPKASLYEGITYDPKQFAVTVKKDQNGQEEDNHFSIDRIDEYQVTYDLTRLSDNQKMSEFQRYVWVTAPGVTFDAPPLSVDPSRDVDLFKDITYDHTKYEISLVNPNEFDPTAKGVQRISYRLTPKPGTQSQSDQKPAAPDASGEQSGGQTPADQPDKASANQAGAASTNQPGAASANQAGAASTNQAGAASANQSGAASTDQAESALTAQSDSASTASSNSAPAGVQNAAVGKSGSDNLLMGDANASGDSSTSASGATTEHTYALAAAIFGRDVTSGSQPFIKWDVKPLVITQGAVEPVNLLSGVKAVNEKGEPVQVVVQDRSQIDSAINAAEAGTQKPAAKPASGSNGGKPSDSGKPSDAAKPSDAGKNPDAAKPSDSGKNPDTGKPSNSGKPSDAAKPSDSGKNPDAGKPSDSGKAPNAAKPSDSGKAPNTVKPSNSGKASNSGKSSNAQKSQSNGKDVARSADDSGPLILPPWGSNQLSAANQSKASKSNGALSAANGMGASNASNGAGTAKASKDGAGSNGAASNGTASNGAGTAKASKDGAGSNGAGSGGTASNGAASSGAASNGAASSGTVSNGAATNSAGSGGAATNSAGSGGTAPNGAASNDAASNQPSSQDILVGEDATLTPEMVAALQPGVTYNFIMLAKDPVTGMESRQTRSAMVRSVGTSHAQVQFSTDNGVSWSSDKPSVIEKGTIPKALSYIKTECSAGGGFVPSKSQPVIARIMLSGNLDGSSSTPYTFDATDQKALSDFKMANPWLTVRLSTPNPDSQNTYDQAAYRLLIATSKGIQFPSVSDSSQYAAFEMRGIRLDSSDSDSECYIQAMGSKLTMGGASADAVVHLASNGDIAYRVVGGQYGSNPGQLNTDVTVYGAKKVGTGETYYRNVCGGNWNNSTTGSTHVKLYGATISDKTGASPQNVWGGGAGLYADQNGDSTVEVFANGDDQGNIKILYGGCAGEQLSGTTTVIVNGGSIGTIYGGSVGNQIAGSTITINGGNISTALYGAGSGFIGNETNPCHIQITVNGGSIQTFYAGTASKQVGTGSADVYVNGGSIKDMQTSSDLSPTLTVNFHVKGAVDGTPGATIGKTSMPAGLDQTKVGVVNMDVTGDLSVQAFDWFTTLTLKENATLTIANSIQNTKTNFGVMSGKVIFEKNSTLQLNSHKKSAWSSFSPNQIGSFQTKGPGAVLELYRDKFTDRGTLNVYTKDENDMTTLKSNPLTLRFIGPDAETADTGTPVFYYDWSGNQASTGNKALAAHPEWYRGDFVRGLGVSGDPASGKITVGGGSIGLQSKAASTDKFGDITYYGTIAAADQAIQANDRDYMVSIRKEGYSLTPADGAAIAGAKVTSGRFITYTSQFVAKKNDPLQSSAEEGQTVKRTVLIGPDIPSGHEAVISFPSNTNISDITLQYSAKGSIFANGHTLNINNGVDVQSQTQYFPVLYGGAEKTQVASTNLQISGGKFSGIYGGGKEADAYVAGEANLNIKGGTLTGPLYGGGKAGNVGSVELVISGGMLDGTKNLEYLSGTAVDETKTEIDGTQNVVIAGGETGYVQSNCKVTITGGTATGPTTVAGCDQGTVKGQVDMSITKTGTETTIKLPLANVYGGGLRGGTVAGHAELALTSGSDYGTISGGGNPGYKWPSGTSAYSSVGGQKNIYVKGNAFEVYNVLNFDIVSLNNETNMTVKGNMDYDPASKSIAPLNPGIGPGNYLQLNWKSVINFSKADGAVDYNPTLRVGGLNIMDIGAHLHIYKDKLGTHPLTVEGSYYENFFEPDPSYPDDYLNLGVIEEGSGGSDGGGALGDILLKFPNKNAIPQFYIADSSSMEIETNADKTQIQYGKRDYPQGTMTGVELTDQNGIDVIGATSADPMAPQKITKKLKFRFDSNHQATGGYSGHPVTDAYVDTTSAAAVDWIEKGDLPANSTKVTLTQGGTTQAPFWTGEATVQIPLSAAPNSYQEYYAHVKTENNKTITIACDVEPILTSAGNTPDETSSSGEGSYTFTRSFKDYVFLAQYPAIPYTASGLGQWGWSVGTTSGPDPTAISGAIQKTMVTTASSSNPGGLTVGGTFGGNLWAPQAITFTVSPETLDLKPGEDPAETLKDKMVYIFLKDKMGNTSELRIPMSQSRISFTLPTRVGVVALRNPESSTSQVLAPNCRITNNDTNVNGPGIKVEITGAEVPSQTSPLQFVNTIAPGHWETNQITMLLKSVPGSSSFTARPILDIHDKPTQTLSLGNIWPQGSVKPQSSFVDFTFGAQFDPQINLTDDWSWFNLSYRFSILPTEPVPAPAAARSASGADQSLKAEKVGTEGSK